MQLDQDVGQREGGYRRSRAPRRIADSWMSPVWRATRSRSVSGTTRAGDPYLRVFPPEGVLGQGITEKLLFERSSHTASGAMPLVSVHTILHGTGEKPLFRDN